MQNNQLIKNEITPNKFIDIISRYTNHIPDKETLLKMSEIRSHVRELAYLIEMFCPESREKASSLTELSKVMMLANSAIVQRCPINIDDLKEWEKQNEQISRTRLSNSAV